MKRFAFGLLGFGLLCATACSTTNDDDGVVDAGPMDTGPTVDSGPAPGLCATHTFRECDKQEVCPNGEQRDPPTNCMGCLPWNKTMCSFGACESRDPLMQTDLIEVALSVGVLEPTLQSFATAGVATETSGGNTIDCAGIYDGTIDLTNTCYNVIDSRGRGRGNPVGDVFKFLFSTIPSNTETLFLVWGYDTTEAQGTPVGISCTKYSVGAPGSGGVEVEGDMMRPIQ